MTGSKRSRLLIALAFLLPNLIGFVVFTAGPIVFSLAMSFTDWALTKHNQFSDTPVRFIGFQNYHRLLIGDESIFFWDYFGNTAYLMIGIPVGIAGSLVVALLLNAKLTPTRAKSRTTGAIVALVIGIGAVGGAWAMTTPGPMPTTSTMSIESGLTDISQWDLERLRSNAAVLATALLALITVLGLALGPVFFRTVFYLPSLLAGVAMFLLWKTLYKPEGGLINAGLRPALASIHHAVSHSPPFLWKGVGIGLLLATALVVVRSIGMGIIKLRYRDCGIAAFLGRIVLTGLLAVCGAAIGYVVFTLPAAVAASPDGFQAPEWLVARAWAKNALILMGVWLGIGGGNMLLFLAGLSNIPPELYEAGDIDGATGWNRFIHITWPQLAPTTFFIVIMSTIAGLQGGFEQAMVMTKGFYDTTVLAYYLYNLAFTDQFQLGLASAVAWVMFAMIFLMTLINYRFGSHLTNDSFFMSDAAPQSAATSSRSADGNIVLRVLGFAALAVLGATFTLPFIWQIMLSLSSLGDVDRLTQTGTPPSLHPENYAHVFDKVDFGRYFFNSIFIAGWATILQMITCAMAAYAFARIKWPGRDKVFLLYLATLMIPGAVLMVPNFAIVLGLGMFNDYSGLIIPAAFSAYGTFLLRQFMLGIPSSLDEAASIDGAGHWRIFSQVILPLARPGLIVLAIFAFLFNYGSFFWPLVLVKDDNLRTLPIGLMAFDTTYGRDTPSIMAASLMAMIPPTLIFIVLQKYLVKGIQLGAVKG